MPSMATNTTAYQQETEDGAQLVINRLGLSYKANSAERRRHVATSKIEVVHLNDTSLTVISQDNHIRIPRSQFDLVKLRGAVDFLTGERGLSAGVVSVSV